MGEDQVTLQAFRSSIVHISVPPGFLPLRSLSFRHDFVFPKLHFSCHRGRAGWNLRADIKKAATFSLYVHFFTSLSVRGALRARCQHLSETLLLTKHLHTCHVATSLNSEDRHKQMWTWTVSVSLGPRRYSSPSTLR